TADWVRKAARERHERAQRDRAYLEQAARILGGSLPSATPSEKEAPSVAEVVAQLRIDELLKRAKAADTDEGLAAQRLLNSLSVQTAFYMPRSFIERKEDDRALWCLDIASRIEPADPRGWLRPA